jgi:hypothetical protein
VHQINRSFDDFTEIIEFSPRRRRAREIQEPGDRPFQAANLFVDHTQVIGGKLAAGDRRFGE